MMRHHLLAGVSTLMCGLWAVSAQAQDTQTPDEAEAAGEAQTQPTASRSQSNQPIIVRATKLEERVEDVSVAITAIEGEVLEDRQINEVRELVYLSPSLKLNGAVTNNSEGFAVRGVGTSVFGALQQATAAVLDGVSVDPTVIRQGLIDVERIEVLRGPQGTLFGQNSSAGLIHVITRQPNLDRAEAIVRAHGSPGGAFDEFGYSVVGNVPIGGHAAVRLLGHYNYRQGFVRNVIDGRRFFNYDDLGMRARVLVEPAPNFSANLVLDYSEQENPYRPAAVVFATPGGPLDTTLRDLGIVPQPDNLESALNGEVRGDTRYMGGALTLELDVGDRTSLTSISSLRRRDQTGQGDTDLVPINLFDINSSVGRRDDWSQEIRLNYSDPGTVQGVLGAYYSYSKQNSSIRFAGPLVPGLEELGLGFDIIFNPLVRTRSRAVFGQVEYSLTDDIRLVTGARYNSDRISLLYNSVYPSSDEFFNLGFPGYPELTDYEERETSNQFSFRLGGEFDVTEDLMVYATFTRGYKGPGFNTIGVNPGTGPGQRPSQYVGPEVPTNYEIGFQGYILNRTTRFQLVGFYTEFKDYQAQFFDNSTGPVGQLLVQNAGELVSKGVEFEISSSPIVGLNLTGGAAYIHATYRDFPQPCYPGQTAAQGCNIQTTNADGTPGEIIADADGNNLVNSPRWTFFATGNYEFPVSRSVAAFFGANYYWRSSVHFSPLEDPRTRVGAYGVLGAQIGLADPDGVWRFTLYAKNLLDERFETSVSESAAGLIGDDFAYNAYYGYDSFRQIGVSLDLRF